MPLLNWSDVMSRKRRTENGLLFLRLDLDKPHGRATNGFTDRFRINGIILATLHIGFDVASRHQFHIVAKLGQLASPVVGRSAGLHSEDAWWERLKEGQ